MFLYSVLFVCGDLHQCNPSIDWGKNTSNYMCCTVITKQYWKDWRTHQSSLDWNWKISTTSSCIFLHYFETSFLNGCKGRKSLFLLQITHQIPAPVSLISTALQCVGHSMVRGTGVRERPCGGFSGPVSVRSGGFCSAVLVCRTLSSAVPLCFPLAVRRQRVILFWTVAGWPTVVAVTILSSGAAFGWSVTIFVHPPSTSLPSTPSYLSLQHTAE